MSVSADFVYFLISLLVLVASASAMVLFIARIARFLRMSDFVVSFIIIGFSTSIPELFVGITSALAGNPSLSLGNIIGANISDLTLVVGIPILIAGGVRISTKTARHDVNYMMIIAAVPLLLMSLGDGLSRLDGVILIAVFIFYLYRMIGRHKEVEVHGGDDLSHGIVLTFIFFAVSMILVLISSHYVVKQATVLSVGLELPLIIMGLVLLGVGTSLPELSFNIRTVRQKHPEMALGNAIGSIVANSTLVLGIVAVIHPIEEAVSLYFTSWVFLLLVAFIFLAFLNSGSKMTWQEGTALILLYVFFLIIELYVKGVVVGAA